MPDRDDATVLPLASLSNQDTRKPRAQDMDEVKVEKPPRNDVGQEIMSSTAQAVARSSPEVATAADLSEKEREIKKEAAAGRTAAATGVPLKTPRSPHDNDEDGKAQRAIEASAAHSRPGAVLIRGMSSTLSEDGSDETREVDDEEYDVDSNLTTGSRMRL